MCACISVFMFLNNIYILYLHKLIYFTTYHKKNDLIRYIFLIKIIRKYEHREIVLKLINIILLMICAYIYSLINFSLSINFITVICLTSVSKKKAKKTKIKP